MLPHYHSYQLTLLFLRRMYSSDASKLIKQISYSDRLITPTLSKTTGMLPQTLTILYHPAYCVLAALMTICTLKNAAPSTPLPLPANFKPFLCYYHYLDQEMSSATATFAASILLIVLTTSRPTWSRVIALNPRLW